MIDFEATLKALSHCGVNFVVIGGYAATLHGSAYLTRDLDICYERTPENMERLVSALSPCARSRPKKATALLNLSTGLPNLPAALSTRNRHCACILIHQSLP
jgi:hypothetical protein